MSEVIFKDCEYPLKTKFENVGIGTSGYYISHSSKEGNFNKYLEDFYKMKLPKNSVVHNKDGNKLNNCINYFVDGKINLLVL